MEHLSDKSCRQGILVLRSWQDCYSKSVLSSLLPVRASCVAYHFFYATVSRYLFNLTTAYVFLKLSYNKHTYSY